MIFSLGNVIDYWLGNSIEINLFDDFNFISFAARWADQPQVTSTKLVFTYYWANCRQHLVKEIDFNNSEDAAWPSPKSKYGITNQNENIEYLAYFNFYIVGQIFIKAIDIPPGIFIANLTCGIWKNDEYKSMFTSIVLL